MTRTIKASEVKPDMTIQWEVDDSVIQTYAKAVKYVERNMEMVVTTRTEAFWYIRGDTPVTVLLEPQPEEPTSFGARVIVAGRKIIRVMGDSEDNLAWEGEDSNGGFRSYTWARICSLGPVTVLPETDWTVPDASNADQGVPERIDEWGTWEDVPEGVAVTHPGMRYYYRKVGGEIEAIAPSRGLGWFKIDIPLLSLRGPWTRVATSTISQEQKENE